MSELSEDFKFLKEVRQKKKQDNVKQSMDWLERENIFFICCNECTRHYLVLREIDFWPSTGVWMKRKTKSRGRGVKSLLNFIRRNYPNPEPLITEQEIYDSTPEELRGIGYGIERKPANTEGGDGE